jgi:hypothetical protein
MEEHYDEMERILTRFDKEDLKNITQLLKVFEKIVKIRDSGKGYKEYSAKKQLAAYLENLKADGHSEEYLESERINQMRRLGMITKEELLVKLIEQDKRIKDLKNKI